MIGATGAIGVTGNQCDASFMSTSIAPIVEEQTHVATQLATIHTTISEQVGYIMTSYTDVHLCIDNNVYANNRMLRTACNSSSVCSSSSRSQRCRPRCSASTPHWPPPWPPCYRTVVALRPLTAAAHPLPILTDVIIRSISSYFVSISSFQLPSILSMSMSTCLSLLFFLPLSNNSPAASRHTSAPTVH